jgi:ribose transport system permease protein
VFNHFSGGVFLTRSNILILLSHAVIPCFFAWGLSFIFASGFTDFSVGAVLLIAATVGGELGNQVGYVGLVGGGIAVGVGLLFVNFIIYNYTKIPSWVAGLGLAMIYEAIMASYAQMKMLGGGQVVLLGDNVRSLGRVPVIFVVFAIGLVVVYMIYNKTSVGLNIRAAGGNPEVAKMMGINIKKTYIMAGICAGLFFGCAAFINESYAGRVLAMTGLTSISQIFQPLAALLLAQVLQKRINLMIAIPIGALVIAAIFNMLTIAGVPSGTWQETILGAIVIVFGILAQRGFKGVVK